MRIIPVDTSALGAFVLVQAVPATYGDGVRKVSTSGEPISELRVLVTPPQGDGQRGLADKMCVWNSGFAQCL